MCKCKGKCGCNISTVTKGEKGDAGTAEVSFYAFKAQTVTSPETIDVQTAVAADGDYIVQLQCMCSNNDDAAINVTTRGLKNGSPDSSNDNYTQSDSGIAVGGYSTYTHTIKFTGVLSGQNVGFRFLTTGGLLINNGSLTIFKVA